MVDTYAVNPYIRVAMQSVLGKGTVIKQRVIFDYELIYIEKGCFTFVYDGVRYTTGEGRFIFIRPGISHSFEEIDAELSQPHIHFDICYNQNSFKTPVCFKDYPELDAGEIMLLQKDLFSEYPQTPYVTFHNETVIKELFFGVIESYQNKSMLTAKGKLTILLEHMTRDNFPASVTEQQSTPNIITQVKEYIDSVNGIGISLEKLENQFYYSKFHLEKQFKANYGTNIKAYAIGRMMELARVLLRTHSVTSVSDKLGYSSIYSFSRAFKNHTGTSPSDYIKDNKAPAFRGAV